VNLPTRQMLMGMALGAACATALAAFGPGYVVDVFADEMPAGFDTDNLVKFDDRDYQVEYEDWVSTDPISTARVKKIEAGRVTYVDIATTATGTYSTDGLTSRHVQYPGIEVEEVGTSRVTWFASWRNGRWVSFATAPGRSFVSVRGNDGTRYSSGPRGTCVSGRGYSFC
jgi:hypothetical protein